jgi:hypothetical protein
MLYQNVFKFFFNFKLNHWEQIVDEDQKWRLYTLFYVDHFCILIKIASIQILGKCCYTLVVERTLLYISSETIQICCIWNTENPKKRYFEEYHFM